MLPLPASDDTTVDRLAEPVLHWVVRGSARIVVDGRRHEIAAGFALWVPGGSGVRADIRRSDVLVPIPGLRLGALTQPVVVELTASWRPWLLHAFGEALGYLDGASGRELMQRTLDAAAPEPRGVAAPPRPLSEGLVELASAIVAAPAVSVSELARRRLPGWTARTLQRRFLAETGLTPDQWARRQRIATACVLLADGHELGAVANAVGYETVSGFSRPFREHTGMSPGRWQERAASGPMICRPAEAPSPDLLPAQRTWRRANGSHVAVWVLRGRVVLAVGGRELEVGPREAVVLPAGVPNSIRIPAGSLVLPLGFRSGRVGEVGAPIAPARTAADEEDDLIQAMVAAYTDLRPRGFDPSSGFALVQARSTRCETTADDAAVSALASGLATGAVGDPSLAGCARWLGIPGRELSRIINDRAGMTFAQWIRVSRMSRARARLHGGEPASAVSRVLGYAHLPAFSRAFREVHGLSPQGVAASQAQAGEAGRWHRELSDRITRAHAPAPAQPRRAVLGPLSDRTRSSSSSRDR